GPTCLDEWQISSMLVAIGLVIALFGSGSYSLDSLISRRNPALGKKRWWQALTLPLPAANKNIFRKTTYAVSAAVILYVIGMNQVHHGGVWGKLHNYSKIPDIQVTNYRAVNDSTFSLTLYRDKGPETYGSFLIQMEIQNSAGQPIHTFGQDYMKTIGSENIHNRHINKIKTGKHSLVVPLGAKGKVTFHLPESNKLKKKNDYRFVFTDISGRKFTGSK
ncbi:MAG TPA: TQO small subunit DoxA domain-containing protein, partial [Bacteroidales bacterium]|nr:TQO small subunit DoxA domain-containing protein [Bacteroidales bacterium]